MLFPPEASAIRAEIAPHFPQLTRPQQRGLTEWVLGVLLAATGGQSRVTAALAAVTGDAPATVRQRLRDWLRDGPDKACPGATQIELAPCFAALLRWILSWWPPDAPLPLALDATFHRDHLVAIVRGVCYHGTALPVAWAIGPAHDATFAWKEPTRQLLDALTDVVPPERLVLVVADRGLWRPALWQTIKAHGWHPLLRVRPDATFCPLGGVRGPATVLVQPGEEWIGAGVLFRHPPQQLAVTLVAAWSTDQPEPWLLATDLPPTQITPAWYGLRSQIEAGFTLLKSRGWEWERTRRRHPTRVARPWLVLAIATVLTVAVGTQHEAATAVGVPRELSLFQQGRRWLHVHLWRDRTLPDPLTLSPAPWPTTLPGIVATAADPAPPP